MFDMNYLLITGDVSLKFDWREFVKAPEAPANYKDPSKIAEYVSKKTESLELEVLECVPSLLTVSNVEVHLGSASWCFEPNPDPGCLSCELCNLFSYEMSLNRPSLRILGKNAQLILRSMYMEPAEGESIYNRDIRYILMNYSLPFTTLEAMRFTPQERSLLLTDKLMPKMNGRKEADYVMDTLAYWGIVERSNWRTLDIQS